jgi:hypothetical protein
MPADLPDQLAPKQHSVFEFAVGMGKEDYFFSAKEIGSVLLLLFPDGCQAGGRHLPVTGALIAVGAQNDHGFGTGFMNPLAQGAAATTFTIVRVGGNRQHPAGRVGYDLHLDFVVLLLILPRFAMAATGAFRLLKTLG